MKTNRKAAALAVATAVTSVVLGPGVPAYADRVRDSSWYIDFLKLPQAQRITKGTGVTVAVIDTGVSAHPDLKRNLKKGTDVVPGGDGTGRKDTDGHGTAMASLIAGHGRDAKNGTLGVAPEASILPVKASSAENLGSEIVPGIVWAVDAGAEVINLSLSVAPSRPLNEAVAKAVAADVVLVAAAGNTNKDVLFAYPAAMPDVLAVGAVDQNGRLADFSMTGEKVGICAPGAEIVTAGANGRYLKGNGTSDSAALVSGAAALVRAKFPDLSAPEVVHRLTATADDFGSPGKDDQCGYGILNVVKALTADVPPLTAQASTAPSTSVSPESTSASAPATGAAPEAKASSGSILPFVAGAGAGVVVLGGLIALLLARRRRSAR